jgi:POT family proton-dependent oligopeptide transporter
MIPQAERTAATTRSGGRDILGHPRGLAVLFATEAWERFSYFGKASSPTVCWGSTAPW